MQVVHFIFIVIRCLVHKFGLSVRIYKDNFELNRNDSLACSPLLLIPLRYFWAFPSSLKLARWRPRPILPPSPLAACQISGHVCVLGWKPQTQAEDADGSGSCEEIVIAFDSQFVGLKTIRPLKRFVSSKVGH